MKKIFFLAAFVCMAAVSCIGASAAETVITEDDFEQYSVTAVYKDTNLTVSMEGQNDATLTGSYIVNGPGSIYDEDYEGNAAQNLITYARTGDTTAVAVPGGLGNGWQGRYSHPMSYLQGGGGAESDYNQYNRRCSVIQKGSDKVLSIVPARSSYISTFSLYAYDSIDYSKDIKWSSVIRVDQMSDGGMASLALSKGKMNDAVLFTNTSRECGRTEVMDLVWFGSDDMIYVAGDEQIGSYSKNTYYQADIYIPADKTKGIQLTISDMQGEPVAEKTFDDSVFSFSGTVGVEYYAYTVQSAATTTNFYVDKMSLSHITLDGAVTSDEKVRIDGTGETEIMFDSDIDFGTVNADTVQVFDGGTLVEGVEYTQPEAGNNRLIKLYYPSLKPASVYTIVINGVTGTNGIVSKCETKFTTMDLITVSDTAASPDGVKFAVTNNSNEKASVVAIVCQMRDSGPFDNNIYYKLVSLEPQESDKPVEFLFTYDTDLPTSYDMYFIDGFDCGFHALAPKISVNK